ncbi:MAG: MmgE/PrpD family protein [Candidatus Binatia bacterium]
MSKTHTGGIVQTLTDQLAQYSSKTRYEDLGKETCHEVKRRILDTLGCVYGAFAERPPTLARAIAPTLKRGGATVWGTKLKTSIDMATFANGTMIRFLDYNDTYLSKEPCHPSDNLSAILAAAEISNSSGKELLTALAVAYEVICRLCDAASLRKRGWDHVTYGAISSALGTAKIMRLSPQQTAHAVALGATPNNALRQTRVGELSMWKGSAFANAARNGAFAAALAKAGFTGPSEVFEGQHGFWKQVSGDFSLTPLRAGRAAKIFDTHVKHFPAEYHAQSGIEAALSLRSSVKKTEDISEIRVETFDAAVEIIGGEKEKWRPKTRETADHSLPYCIAAALVDGTVGLEQFTARKIRAPRTQRLMQKVKVLRSAWHNKMYPRNLPTTLTIKTKQGETLRCTVENPRGHARNPMSDNEIIQKFKEQAETHLPSRKVQKICDYVWRLEKNASIRDFFELLSIDKARLARDRKGLASL